MAEQNEGIEVSVEELRAKYAQEQLKRLRTDGLKQFSGLKEQFEELVGDVVDGLQFFVLRFQHRHGLQASTGRRFRGTRATNHAAACPPWVPPQQPVKDISAGTASPAVTAEC